MWFHVFLYWPLSSALSIVGLLLSLSISAHKRKMSNLAPWLTRRSNVDWGNGSAVTGLIKSKCQVEAVQRYSSVATLKHCPAAHHEWSLYVDATWTPVSSVDHIHTYSYSSLMCCGLQDVVLPISLLHIYTTSIGCQFLQRNARTWFPTFSRLQRSAWQPMTEAVGTNSVNSVLPATGILWNKYLTCFTLYVLFDPLVASLARHFEFGNASCWFRVSYQHTEHTFL